MADAKLTALTAATALGGTEVLYVVQGGVSKKLTGAQIQAYASAPIASHLAESDPWVHSAPKITYSGTVGGASTVKEAIDVLDASKATNAAIAPLDSRTARLEDLFGGNASDLVATTTGAGTRLYYQDDFRWSPAVATSTQIGETNWLKTTNGTSAIGVESVFHPGVVKITTPTTINTYCALYSNATFGAALLFDFHMWFRCPVVDANAIVRAGLSSDPTAEAPLTGIYAEHLGSDTGFWRNATYLSGALARQVSVAVPTAAQWVHLRIRRVSTTLASFSYTTSSGSVVGPATPAETVTFNPSGAFLKPFIAVKNVNTAAAQSIDIDRVSILTTDITR